MVRANDPFRFETRLDPGMTYEVTVAEQPEHHSCTITGGVGSVGEQQDVSGVAVSCEGPAVSLEVSAPVELGFDADVLAYSLEVSTLVQAITVTVGCDEASAITVNGRDATPGVATDPVELAVGGNDLDVTVQVGQLSRTYALAVLRGEGEVAQLAYIKASNPGMGDNFSSVAIDGDTMAVGAPFEDSWTRLVNGPQDDGRENSGAVYVYRRRAGVWSLEAFIKANNADAGDEFGGAVALSGDTLAVGARLEAGPNNTESGRGAVYVFERAGDQWQQRAILVGSGSTGLENAGSSVSLHGDLLAFGGGADSDDAYVFQRMGTSWTEVGAFAWPVGWGARVTVDGDRVALASQDSPVIVYKRSGDGWDVDGSLSPPTGIGAGFGWSVDLQGDVLVVSDYIESSAGRGIDPDVDDGAPNSGAVYVFRRGDAGWLREAFIKSSNSESGDLFGMSVSIWGDTLVVGASGEDSASPGLDGDPASNGAPAAGAAYLFQRTDDAWSEVGYVKGSNAEAGDSFGSAVAIGADGVAIAARNEAGAASGVNGDDTSNGATQSGAVYVLH